MVFYKQVFVFHFVKITGPYDLILGVKFLTGDTSTDASFGPSVLVGHQV
jgi:hypothetical protein